MKAPPRWVVVVGFLLCAGPVGLSAAWLTPPMQAPDEAAHTVRAAGLLRGDVLARRLWDVDPLMHDYGWQAGLKVNMSLMDVALARQARRGPLSNDVKQAAFAPGRTAFFYAPNTVMYFPAAYVPAALGMAVAVAAHGNAAAVFLAGRLGGLLAYLVLGAVALGVAIRGQAVLLAVLLLPLPVLLSGAITQDAVLLALTCCGVAALTREAAPIRLGGLAALTLLAAAKPPYAPLLLLHVLPWPGALLRWVAAALVLVGAWVVLTAWQVDVPFDVVNAADTRAVFYHPGPLYPGDARGWFYLTDPTAQLAGLAAHKLAVVGVVIRTVAAWRWRMFGDLIGRFGRLELPVGWWLGGLWAAALLVALFAGGRDRRAGAGWPAAVLVLVLVLGSFWAVMLSLYLDNTPIGAAAVMGFYPRYLLPLAPCLVLICRCGAARWAGVAPVLGLGLFDAVYLSRLLWRAYGG